MKKYIFFFFFMLSQNSFALTNQLSEANQYLDKYQNYTNYELSSFINKEQDLKDNIPHVEITKDYHMGEKNKNIQLLKEQYGLEDNKLFDKSLEKKIINFQKKEGLNTTGILDPITWMMMYHQPYYWEKEKIQEAIFNWNNILQKNKYSKMIIVNIPSMTLYFYQLDKNGIFQDVLQSRVIVGKPSTPTPMHDFFITSLEFHPTWTPPEDLIKKEFYKDGNLSENLLKKYHMSIYNSQHQEISFQDIANTKDYYIQQKPSKLNALGILKFETTSKDSIYLHDTNQHYLFRYNDRLYSSGCVRVQKYVKLASLLMNQSSDKIEKMLNQNMDKTFWLKVSKVPVYFDYSQVHFVKSGKPFFFPNVYSNQNFHQDGE